jgi:hypothetical protein
VNLAAFFGAARQYAHPAQHLCVFLQNQEVAAWRAAADPRRLACTGECVGYRAACHGYVRVVVVEDVQRFAAPGAQRGGETFGKRLGAEYAAVEQQRVGHGQYVFAFVSGP